MTAPVIRQYPGTIPDKGQSQIAFDTNVDAFLDWQALQFAPDLVAFGTWTSGVANSVLATALAGDLPALTGKAGDYIRANAAEDGGEFRTPAQVLSDISAASVASVALKAPLESPQLTGTPMAPTAAAATNTTQLATTAYTRTAIPNVLNASGSAPIYACRAWVNFDGTGSVSIRGSGNVSSITDLWVGVYRINFAVNMQDNDYAVFGTSAGVDDQAYLLFRDSNTAQTTSRVAMRCTRVSDQSRGMTDVSELSVAIFR